MPDEVPPFTPARARHAGIVDVARLAGVSPGTVSRSLRGHQNVSPITRQKVLDAARELSYRASPQASGLASGRTRTIGVVVPYVTRWFYANAVAGAYDVLSAAGYDVLLYHLGSAEARDRFFERMPLTRRVDAVLTLTLGLTEEHVRALRALDIPLVTIGRRLPGVACVRIDDAEAVRHAVYHLVHQGHREIAMISGEKDEDGFDFRTWHDRREGFVDALASAGIEAQPELMPSSRGGIEGGAQAMAQLLSGPRLPTAVLAEYDELAIGALRTLRRAGVAVPGRVSVVGIDDHEMAAVVDLTTVAQPVSDQGAAAGRMLLDILAGAAPDPVDVVVPTRLVIRGTTAAPRRG
jgi:DNA-binding LacI/PurR family transcriptional regulator